MDFELHHTFRNWSHTIDFKPGRFCRPQSEADVVRLVQAADQGGERVRIQGAGHSFSQLLPTDGTLATLDEIPPAITVNGRSVTVSAGIRLKNLIKELKSRGLGLKNLGSITEQSIAGATATGTHGTGLRLGSLSSQIESVRLVTGTGAVKTIAPAAGDDFEAARMGLGLLGVLTEVTLSCVDHYKLEYSAYLTTFDHVLPQIETLIQENERILLWWLVPPAGPRDCVIVITKNPLGHPPGILGGAQDGVVPLASGLLQALLPQDGNHLATLAASAGVPSAGFKRIWHRVDDYEDILTIPLLPIFHRECEYAVPVNNTREALRQMRRVFDEGDVSLRLPVEVRFLASDSALISPSRGRDVAYIGASTLDNATEVFERFEPLMRDLEGRPHWGKNFTLTRSEVARMYGSGYTRFCEVRREFDPNGVFLNSFLAGYFE